MYSRAVGLNAGWRRFWQPCLVIGAFNAALFAALSLGEQIRPLKSAGFVLGIAGIGLVTGAAPEAVGGPTLWAMAACPLAAVSYGFVSIYTKKFAAAANPRASASVSELVAGLILLPFMPLSPSSGPLKPFIAVNLTLFALLSGGLAFSLY